jgi:hypothetical protein
MQWFSSHQAEDIGAMLVVLSRLVVLIIATGVPQYKIAGDIGWWVADERGTVFEPILCNVSHLMMMVGRKKIVLFKNYCVVEKQQIILILIVLVITSLINFLDS